MNLSTGPIGRFGFTAAPRNLTAGREVRSSMPDANLRKPPLRPIAPARVSRSIEAALEGPHF
ncbi:hypothetical protein MKK67_10800 [Methylobacterium sp. J-072]|uniref:hypothetical protein n=1 Tax=Methylobacterium sp. J-072 TaxID=2836651 RepID=UPI001FBB979F|nr:hypothetical protein [Methylobacterium sp. J-072]MCJ2092983.1 hypothetical protein [Methylobacterium sp. J-072]